MKLSAWAAAGVLAYAALAACSGAKPAAPAHGADGDLPRDGRAATEPEAPVSPDTAKPSGPLVIFLGDSLTAGRGLAEDQAYPAILGKLLRADGFTVRILNAGVSGDTTAGGLSRLDWLLGEKPDVVVVELGGNDGLRGLPVEMSEANLRKIVKRCLDSGAGVLLAGMMMPPSYGPEYTAAFKAIYPAIARETGVPLLPFLLEGVAGEPGLNLEDGIHPNAAGQEKVARNVLPYLESILARRAARPAGDPRFGDASR